ncbi:sulfotransferase domain-containing protein [Coraliomargarita sp. W4R53]
MYPKVAFCSHHKCATKWFLRYFRFGCKRLGWKIANVDNQSRKLEAEVHEFCAAQKIDFLFYSNASYPHVAALKVPVVHLVRDPRDILVSGYYSHRDSHETDNWPELVDYRAELKACEEREGLLKELDFSAQFLQPMDAWPLSSENVHTHYYEDFAKYPIDSIQAMLTDLGLIGEKGDCAPEWLSSLNGLLSYAIERGRLGAASPIQRDKLLASEWLGEAYDIRFSKLKSGAAKSGGPQGHYRKGGHGQWREQLQGDLLAGFNARYGNLVTHYGYTTIEEPLLVHADDNESIAALSS